MPTVLKVTTKVMDTGETKMTMAFRGNKAKTHKGVDLIPKSTSETPAIFAFESGTVIQVQNMSGTTDNTGSPGMGTSLGIKHADGKITRYQHLKYNSIKVKKGEKVNKGQVIAYYGRPTNGNSDGPHLHFDISLPDKPSQSYVKGSFCGMTRYYVDPVPYLTKVQTEGKKYTVTASVLNVRKGPGTNYAVVDTKKKGSVVTVVEEKNGFGRIGPDKWVSMD